jgi:hypothetical protein
MFPYFILVIIPTVIAIFEMDKKSEKNKSMVTFFLIMFVLLSLRNINCGVDLISYNYFFKENSRMTFEKVIEIYSEEGEVLYYLLNKIISLVTNNFQIFLAIVAAICIIPIAIFYKRESKNPILTISLFLTVAPFSMFFSGLRQSIAMAIVIMAFRFIKEKKIIPYIIMILIAFGFHQSAIIMLLLYPLYHAKITKKWLIVIVPLMIMIFIFKNQIFSSLILFSSKYAERYNEITSTGSYSILILLCLFNIYCFAFTNREKETKEFIGLRNFLLCATCIQFFASINTVIMRINYYILLFIPILIPMVYNNSDIKYRKIVRLATTVMCTFFISYFFIKAYTSSDILNVYPYVPYWN